jgi:hypothetical protein
MVSLPVDSTNDRHVSVEVRRADGRPMGKRLHIEIEASPDGAAWYPLNTPTLVVPAEAEGIFFTIGTLAVVHWRLRSSRKPPSDLLLRVVGQ